MDQHASQNDPLIIQFLSHLEIDRGRAVGTVVTYFMQLNRFNEYLSVKKKSILNATPEDIELFTGLYLHELGISPRSRRIAIAALRGFYKWSQRKGLCSSNPASSLHYPKTGRKLPSSISRKHAESLLMQTQLSEFTGIRNAAIISVLMGCGLRVSGVSRLNESDLVYDTDENGKESAYLRVVEKGNNQRAVPLPDESFLFIRAYLGHPELDKIDRSLPNGDRVLFVNIRNPKVKNFDNCGDLRRLSTSGIRRMVYNLGQQAGLPKECCHPHALRHLYGTELVEAGTDTLTVQTLMGHKDANSTKVYIHLSTRRLRKAVDKGNPLGKMKTQVSGLTHLLHR